MDFCLWEGNEFCLHDFDSGELNKWRETVDWLEALKLADSTDRFSVGEDGQIILGLGLHPLFPTAVLKHDYASRVPADEMARCAPKKWGGLKQCLAGKSTGFSLVNGGEWRELRFEGQGKECARSVRKVTSAGIHLAASLHVNFTFDGKGDCKI